MVYLISIWAYPLLGLTVLLGVLTPSILITWVRLELSLLLFLTLLSIGHNAWARKEDVLYYFINQALGSTLILFSWVISMKTPFSLWMMGLALLLKIGLFPFHSWYLNIVNIINHSSFWVLRVPLKLITLKLIFTSRSVINSLILGTINIVVSFIFVFKEKKPISFLALASIFNTGWAILGLVNSWIWVMYILIYGLNLKLVLMSLEIILKSNFSNHKVQRKSIHNNQILLARLIVIGIPPFTGFRLKIIIFLYLVELSWRLGVLAILVSLIMLFYYILIFFYSLRVYNSYSEILVKNWVSIFISPIILVNFWISILVIIWLVYYLNNKKLT